MAKKETEYKAKTPTVRQCGTDEVHERLLRTVSGYKEGREACENHAWRAGFSPMVGRTGCTKIPVVVHIVHKTAAQNISDAQVKSQIDVLNEDFRKKNPDVSTCPAPFQPLTADARIEFELASKDPKGEPTTGIRRTKTNKDSFPSDDSVKFSSTGGADAWPRDTYLNIWVCQLGGNLLGYAQFPGGPADTDGVVILHSGFGTTGTAAPPFDLGRTTTHEVGHWLNLRHIWGDDGQGCSGSDFVSDTPNQAGSNLGVPTFPSVSCNNGPNGDMFMNYMDYVNDAAMVMFSAGQVARMQAALDGPRSVIGTSIPCGKVPPKDLPKELPKDLPKDPPKDLPKDPPKDLPKDPPKDLPKDPPKDLPKDPPKDLPKDPPKDLPKDPPKDLPKDPPKDLPKDPPKDLPKDPPKDLPKDPPKDLPKDPPKDLPKDPPKDPPKDIPKDGPKDFIKDLLKDGPKDIFKDRPKDAPFDPKGPLDPPKGLFENPSIPGGAGGGTPFVLATPATGRADCGCQEAARQQNAALAAHYAQLLTQYAQLYAAGQLDASGMAAWQQVADAYQRLMSGGG